MKITYKEAPFEHEIHEPDTSWHNTLVGVVVMIALCFFIFIGVTLYEVSGLLSV